MPTEVLDSEHMWLAQEWQRHGRGERGRRFLTQVYLLFNRAAVFISQLHNLLCGHAGCLWSSGSPTVQHGDWCPCSVSHGSQLPVCGSPRLEFHAGVGKLVILVMNLETIPFWSGSIAMFNLWSKIVESCARSHSINTKHSHEDVSVHIELSPLAY